MSVPSIHYKVTLMRIFRLILFFIALTLLGISIMQFRNGYKDWQDAQRVEKNYQGELQWLENKRDNLKKRVELLENDTLTKERLVRKKFGYVKPGEVQFRIIKPTQFE